MAFHSDIHEGIAHLVLNKPPVNAFNSAEWAGIAAEIKDLGEQDAVRVIVISAEGKGFCAGVDIKELGAEPAKIVPVNKGNYDTFEAIHRNPKPVILAIHGFVLGGGIGMAGAADILVASECATFGVPEVDRGAMGEVPTCSGSSRCRRCDICILPANSSTPPRRGDWARLKK